VGSGTMMGTGRTDREALAKLAEHCGVEPGEA
jgi:hypothetical protein